MLLKSILFFLGCLLTPILSASGVSCWTPPTTLSETSSNGFFPQSIVIDPFGNATVAWVDSRIGSSIFASRFDHKTSTWSSSDKIFTPSKGNSVGGPKLAVDSLGNVIAIWDLDDVENNLTVIQASRFDVTSKWSVPVEVASAPKLNNTFQNYQVIMDSNGDAIAVWQDKISTTTGIIQASRFSLSTMNWTPPVTLTPTLADLSNGMPQIQLDSFGNAIAIWVAVNSQTTTLRIDASRFDINTLMWSTPTHLLNVEAVATLVNPRLAVDLKGNAIALWNLIFSGEKGSQVQASHFNVNTLSWQTHPSVLIETGPEIIAGGSTSPTQVAFEKDGNALAVWQLSNTKTKIDKIQAIRFFAKTKHWSEHPKTLATSPMNVIFPQPQLGIDAAGTAILVWRYRDVPNNIFQIQSVRYDISKEKPSSIHTISGTDSITPFLAVNKAGQAAATFISFEGTPSFIQAVNFLCAPKAPLKPSDLTVKPLKKL